MPFDWFEFSKNVVNPQKYTPLVPLAKTRRVCYAVRYYSAVGYPRTSSADVQERTDGGQKIASRPMSDCLAYGERRATPGTAGQANYKQLSRWLTNELDACTCFLCSTHELSRSSCCCNIRCCNMQWCNQFVRSDVDPHPIRRPCGSSPCC